MAEAPCIWSAGIFTASKERFSESMRYAQLIMGPAGSGKVGKLVYWTFALQYFLKTIEQKSLGQGRRHIIIGFLSGIRLSINFHKDAYGQTKLISCYALADFD